MIMTALTISKISYHYNIKYNNMILASISVTSGCAIFDALSTTDNVPYC